MVSSTEIPDKAMDKEDLHPSPIEMEQVQHDKNNNDNNNNSLQDHGDSHAGALGALDGHDNALPKGYFYSPFFIGTMAALCFNLTAAVGGFALIAPILMQINNDIGPSSNIVWVALIYTICLAIGLALVGRLSDLFGRRYFFIGGNALGLLGCIICCTAKSVPVLIGGETLVGLAASTGASYPFIMGEIVPMKYRFATNAFVYLFQLPTSCFGPAMAYVFILQTSAGWRWCYYYLIIWNALALILFIAFYFPPTFREKHGTGRVFQFIKQYDYIGTGLFIAGIVLLLMGLTWGGSVYPWKSAHVLAPLVIGAVTLIAFALYETFMPLSEPFIPMKLFKNGKWVATVLVISFCGGVYYAFALVWPNMVATLYARENDPMYTGYLSCIVAIGITAGEIIGCIVAEPIGKTKLQLIASTTIGAIFLSSVATCNENTSGQAIALLFLGTVFIGYTDGVAIVITTIEIADQSDIGVATGVMGAMRSIMGSICAAIYTVILTNRMTATVGSQVPVAVVGAGLPAQSVASFLLALTSGSADALGAVQGLTPAILAAGQAAYRHAAADAFRTVFLSSIAFSVLAVVLTFFTPNVDHRMTLEVSALLHQGMRDHKEPKNEKLERLENEDVV